MTTRWGIIGCGNVTEVKSGPGFQKARDSALVAVMRRDAALAEDYARRHDVPRWYVDSRSLIDDPDVDAVYVATPVGSHLELALDVCAAGKPCYVEKPMARNRREAGEMVEAFSHAGVPLFVAYYRRGLKRFALARDLVATGRLGTVTSVVYRQTAPQQSDLKPQGLPWRYEAERSGGGLFLDVGCHTLDILDFILGPIKNVRGAATNNSRAYDVEDVVAMAFTIGTSGAAGIACWYFVGTVAEDAITIDGTEGRLTLSTFGDEPLQLETRGRTEEFELPNPPHIQQPLIQSIVNELHGRGACPSTGGSAIRTSAVMDDALHDYYGGREDAFWRRPHAWPGRRRG